MLKNSLARRVFTDMGMDGLSQYLEGPLGGGLGGEGITELAKEIIAQVKALKKPADQGGRGRWRGRRPGAGRGHHQAAQPRGLDRPGDRALAGPGAADAVRCLSSPPSTVIGQLEALAKRQRGRSARRGSPNRNAEASWNAADEPGCGGARRSSELGSH